MFADKLLANCLQHAFANTGHSRTDFTAALAVCGSALSYGTFSANCYGFNGQQTQFKPSSRVKEHTTFVFHVAAHVTRKGELLHVLDEFSIC